MSAKNTKADVALSAEEKALLKKHELVISKGLQTFVAVGEALLDIRDKKLYRGQYKKFEGYCKERWGIAKSQAYRIMEAAEMVGDLSPNGGQMIENERQARALAAVPPHLREQVLQRIKDRGESVTEQVVTQITLALLDENRAAKEGGPEEAFTAKTSVPPRPREDTILLPKPTLYVPRGHEQQRLALKDALAAKPADVKTKKDRRIVQQTIELARATADRWEELLGVA
jgi:hypothetical protein